MKQFVLLLFVVMTSCQKLKVEKIAPETILQSELQSFNWNDVDTYPTFNTCDSLTAKMALKQCFENTLSTHLLQHLNAEQIVVTQDINDTINIEVTISKTGTLSLGEITTDSITQREIPTLSSMLAKSAQQLPKIYPAIKRGQHVQTQFKLPLVIAVQ